VVVDTLGIATPEAVAFLIGRIRAWCGPALTIHFHGHNDFGLATACAVAAAAAGASWVHGTVDGIGERAGNANLPEIAMTLEMLYGVDTGFAFEKIRSTSARLREIGGYAVEPWKAVVGDNVFVRETGAVAAQFHIPPAIEPYSSTVLDTPRGIVLGKKSGIASIAIKVRELGLDVAEDRFPALLAAVKQRAIAERGLIDDAAFVALVDANR
jgi:isopropylmalate/homocitrate/citramalate synthase